MQVSRAKPSLMRREAPAIPSSASKGSAAPPPSGSRSLRSRRRSPGRPVGRGPVAGAASGARGFQRAPPKRARHVRARTIARRLPPDPRPRRRFQPSICARWRRRDRRLVRDLRVASRCRRRRRATPRLRSVTPKTRSTIRPTGAAESRQYASSSAHVA